MLLDADDPTMVRIGMVPYSKPLETVPIKKTPILQEFGIYYLLGQKKSEVYIMAYDRHLVAKEKLDKVLIANSEGIVMSYTVNTMEDQRVRPECAKFEGHTANVSDAVIGVNHPPLHEDCRCFATYKIERIQKK